MVKQSTDLFFPYKPKSISPSSLYLVKINSIPSYLIGISSPPHCCDDLNPLYLNLSNSPYSSVVKIYCT